MLDPDEAAAVAEEFRVSDEQVRRDHLLSHLLSALAGRLPRHVVFFGGTALARTHLPHGRLSEDLDLLAVPQRTAVVSDVEDALETGVLREYGRLSWDPRLSAVKDTVPAALRSQDGLVVQVQLLDLAGHPAWPTERRSLHQRYSDAPPANLRVPTLAAFATSKAAAWHDRHAPRDLYDLWGLAALGALDADAAALFARLGPSGQPPRSWTVQRAARRRRLDNATRSPDSPHGRTGRGTRCRSGRMGACRRRRRRMRQPTVGCPMLPRSGGAPGRPTGCVRRASYRR